MKQWTDKVKESIQSIITMFESGKMPEAISRTVIHRLKNDVPSGRWSLSNQLIMFIAGTTDARGIKQWNEVGRRVKKSAKAFYILAPRIKKIEEEDQEGNIIEKTIIAGFLSVPVFRYEDTEGKPLQFPDYHPVKMPPLIKVANAYGIKVDYNPFTERFFGYYSCSENRIVLCTHDVKTFFHELAHAIHNTFRPLNGSQHKDQEVVAETVAATLCHLYGYDGYIYHGYQYIKGYARDGDPVKVVMRVLADVEKVLNLIFNGRHLENQRCDRIVKDLLGIHPAEQGLKEFLDAVQRGDLFVENLTLELRGKLAKLSADIQSDPSKSKEVQTCPEHSRRNGLYIHLEATKLLGP